MSSTTKEYKERLIIVKALPAFYERRLLTIPPITNAQYRDLKAGKNTKIEKRNFDPKIFEEIKNGND